MAQEEPIEDLQNVASGHSGAAFYGQRLAGVFVKHGQHPVGAAIAQLVVHEVDAPDMVGMRRSEPDDRIVVMVEPFARLVALRLLQAFFAPEALQLLVVYAPALDPQEFENLAVAIAAIALGKADHGQSQVVVGLGYSPILHRAARETDHLAGPSLRCHELLACVDEVEASVLRVMALVSERISRLLDKGK